MNQDLDIEGRDIDIALLIPVQERRINLQKHAGYRKIVASIKAIGLIEPLCVYQEDGKYNILDGYLRYKACVQLGVETVPCLLYRTKQAYSYNKQVNRLSSYQEMRMLRKASESIPEPEIAGTLGLKTIKHRLSPTLIKHLHPESVELFKRDKISKQTAMELTYVKPEHQLKILTEMESIDDYSLSFCRTLVIKCPNSMRNPKIKMTRTRWADNEDRKKDVISRLEKAEKQHDFYASLYRQYSTDLMKMIFYGRKLISNPRILTYIKSKHPEILARMRQIIFEDKDGQKT